MIGKTISHYRIIDKLGEGGMGVVYRAEDTALDRHVALKFLSPQALGTEDALDRFVREAKTAASLSHPNICTIYEIGEAGGQTFIAMALIEGESLKDRIERGPLKLSDAVDLARQVSEGLSAAHKKGIVHRDLKPGNVMVTAEGRAKIMDFGLAKAPDQARLTKTGTTTGTVAYMSPEQSRGEDVDERTDIWSFGVMLYEIVTGRRPFVGDYEQAVVYSIMNDEPEPVTGLRTGVPMELERIIAKAITKRVDERYQHADDLTADLKSLQRELDSGTTTVSIATRAMPVRRAGVPAVWRWVIAAAVVVVAMGTAWKVTQRGAPATTLDPDKVVVAMFENRTGDESLDRLGQRVADAIGGGLAQVEGVEVVPAAMATDGGYGGSRDPVSLAEASGAGFVVSGAYYLTGDSLSFRADLTDAQERKVVATVPSIGGPRGSPAAPIEELRQRAVGAVSLRAGEVSRHLVPPKHEALRIMRSATRFFGNDYPAAIELYERAAELDTLYMTPWFSIAGCYYNQSLYAKSDSVLSLLSGRRDRLSRFQELWLDCEIADQRHDFGEWLRLLRRRSKDYPGQGSVNYDIGRAAMALNRPREAAEAFKAHAEARGHDSGLSGSFTYTGWATALHLLGEYEEELEVARRGREAYPDLVWMLGIEARALVALGRLEEMEALVDESLAFARGEAGSEVGEMSPGDVILSAATALRVHAGREESIEMAERAVAWYTGRLEGTLIADDWWGHLGRGAAFWRAERWQDALALYSKLLDESPGPREEALAKVCVGCMEARLGNRDRAWELLEELRRCEDPYDHGYSQNYAADIAAQLGERELAVELFREALSRGYDMVFWFHVDMEQEPLYGYPPYEELRRPKG